MTTSNASELGAPWPGLADSVLAMERAGLVTRTFRRLDPERQTAVIRAILEMAEQRGLAHVNVKEVAASASVSVGSLYQYFGNRERMVDFAIALTREHMVSVFASAGPYLVELPLREALVAYVQGGCDWMSHEMVLMRLFARAAYQGDERLDAELVTPIAAIMRQLVRDLLAAARSRGELRCDLDLDEAARLVHAFTVALGDARFMPHLDHYLQLEQTSPRGPAVLATAIDILMGGLASAPKATGELRP